MSYRSHCFALVIPALALSPLALPAQETRPNVVLIMTDDQGYGDLGATGNPVIRTPHLDALAAGSASMLSFYVSPVCSPTRAALMTGRYPYRTRVVDTFVSRLRRYLEPDPSRPRHIVSVRGHGYRLLP